MFTRDYLHQDFEFSWTIIAISHLYVSAPLSHVCIWLACVTNFIYRKKSTQFDWILITDSESIRECARSRLTLPLSYSDLLLKTSVFRQGIGQDIDKLSRVTEPPINYPDRQLTLLSFQENSGSSFLLGVIPSCDEYTARIGRTNRNYGWLR